MGTKQRKCKCCGALFTPKGAGDCFCSGLCRTSSLFVSGGGDTSKPMSPERKKALEKAGKKAEAASQKKVVKRYKADAAARFPRVVEMLSIPKEHRWKVAKNFTEEEREYARSLAQKELAEERRFVEIASWDGAGDETEEYGEVGEDIGDSDDGTV